MKKDIITEMLVGAKGAVKVIGKVITYKTFGFGKDSRTVILGIVVADLNDEIPNDNDSISENSLEYQLWEGEIIFIPHRKYRGRKKSQEQFAGLRADQVLRSNWGDSSTWFEKIFDRKDIKK